MSEEVGSNAWLLFRKLVEMECGANLTPDWFPFTFDILARWTGIPASEIEPLLQGLEAGGWIERADAECETQRARIASPLPVPLEEEEIRSRLEENGTRIGRCIWRYYQALDGLSQVERVVFLYQMLFGARFTPRIVEDLEWIANTFDMSVIYDAFQEAYAKKVKSLAWIKTHLHLESEPE